GDVSLRDLLVNVFRKEQRNVDIDPFAEALLDRRQSLGRARDLDHYIVAGYGFPETSRFVDRFLRLVGEVRRDFEAYVSVACIRTVVDAAQSVGRRLDVADGDLLELRGRVEIAASSE